MSINLFDNFSLEYDRMINWEKRLQRENPFFDVVFEENNVQTVLDAGCGTGWHAINFARKGYGVMGTDISPAMIDAARLNASGEKVQVVFKESGFTELTEVVTERRDAITCLGNSLPHLLSDQELLVTLAGFYRILNHQGVLIIQIRNYRKAKGEDQRFMPLNQWQGEQGEYLFLRMQDFLPNKVEFRIITMYRPKGGKWDYSVATNELRPLDQQQLTQFLIQAGFGHFEYYGDFDFHPFDENKYNDLIVVAKK